jgi:hypothetical protein
MLPVPTSSPNVAGGFLLKKLNETNLAPVYWTCR